MECRRNIKGLYRGYIKGGIVLSFSLLVKNEICRIDNIDNCCLKAELSAIIIVGNAFYFDENERINIRIITENAAFARRAYSLFKKLFNASIQVKCRKNKRLTKHTIYEVIVNNDKVEEIIKGLEINLNLRVKNDVSYIIYNVSSVDKIIVDPCCKKSFLRGAFLAGGSISDPEKTYHVELICKSLNLAHKLKEIINSYELNSKVIKRKGYYVVYLKEGNHIVDFLNIIGAHPALLKLENIRILKDMRNNVNRVVNCETANLGKTVNASIRQIKNIEYIKVNIGFDNLPKNLREIAELRMDHRDASLRELGELLTPPLGKSGVNHRLRKLEKIAKDDFINRKLSKPAQ
jgi:DNA-binding protein WhiA